ncbi:MAG: hypothetical protein RSC43_05180 [Clostridia bacterium]
MNKRGFTILQTIGSLIILAVVVLALTVLVSRVGTNRATIMNNQTLAAANVNQIEKLQRELSTTGKLVLGTRDVTSDYGFRKLKATITVEASPTDSVYLVTVKSRITSASAASMISTVVLSAGVYYE